MAKNLNITTVKLTLNGKEVEWSLQRIRKEAEKTALKMKGMEAGSKEWKEQFKRLETLHKAEQDLIPTLERVNHYMQEMGKTATTDIGKTIRELTKMRDAMPGDHKDLEQTNQIIEYFKSWQAQNRNLGMTLEKAKLQLNDLVNTPTEKLKQGLAAINKELDTNAKLSKEDRAELKEFARKYEAQMAVNQYGRAGNASLNGMNMEQLRAEQQRLRAGYLATEGATGYERISQDYLRRLQDVNRLLTEKAAKEREDAKAQREAIEQQKQLKAAQEVIVKLMQNQAVSVKDLDTALKFYEQRLIEVKGVDDKATKDILNNINRIKTAKAEIDNIDVHGMATDPRKHSIDELTAASKQGKEMYAAMDPSVTPSSQMRQLQQDILAIDTAIAQLTPKWNELTEAQRREAQVTDVLTRVNRNEKVTLEELRQAEKALQDQIRQTEGQNLPFADQNKLLQAKASLQDIQEVISHITLDHIDFDALDNKPVEELEKLLKQIEEDEKRLAVNDKQASEQMAANKRKVQQAIQRVKNQTIDLADAQKVANERGKHSVQEMQRAYDTLKQHLATLSTSQRKEIAETRQQMKQLKTDIESVTGAVSGQTSVWKSAVRNITAYVGVFGAFNLIKNKLTEVIRGSEELSDQMAKVRMVSGLAMEDIENLTRSLAKLDTRSTLQELTELSYIGSKLGFGELGAGALQEFAKAANQVNVALKEDLGSDAMTALSKITENMGLIKKMGVEQAMLSTSSAMFKLFTTSTAAAGPIVEVTKRLAPMAQISGFATHEILALASASDALMQSEEVAGTAMSKFMMAMQTNHNIIEKSLGITEGSISTMMKSGKSMEAFLTILDKMSGKNVTELTNVWKLLGSEGDRLIRVILAMANHTDLVRQHIDTSSKAFREATAVTEEYNIQQETAMGYLERAENKWRNAFINPDSALAVKEMTKAWYDFTKSITDSDLALGSIKLSIDALLVLLRALIALLPAVTFGLLAKGIAMAVDKMKLMNIATEGFITSWKKMDAATKSNWIGLIVGTATQAVYWFVQWAKSMNSVTKEQKELNNAIENMHEKTDEEIKKLSRLKSQLEDTNITQEERNALLSKVRNDYDIYLNYLGIEKNKVADLTQHYGALIKVMRQRFAYEERENYKRDVMSGEDGVRMKRRGAGADLNRLGQKMGVDADLDLIQTYVKGGKSAKEIYALMFPDVKANELAAQKSRPGGSATYATPGAAATAANNFDHSFSNFKKALEGYVGALQAEIAKENEIDAAFASEIGDFDYDKWLRTQVTGEFVEKPDKAAIAAAKKANQDAKQAMRKEMQDAQEASTGIISKLEEYYRLQEAAINEARADGQLTEERAAEMVRSLNIMKNETLATARRAVTTGDTTEWDKLKQTILPAVLSDTSEVSRTLLETIQKVVVEKLHADLAKFNGSGKVFDLDSRAFFDQMNAKAAGNKREAARLRAKVQNEVERALLQYQFVEQANKKLRGDLETMGIITETYEQWAKRMQEGITEKPDARVTIGQSARAEIVRQFQWDYQSRQQQPATLFNGQPNPAAAVNPDDERQLQQWFQQFATNAEWASGIPQIGRWLKDGEKYKTEIRQFYDSLLQIQQAARQQSEQQQGPLAPLDEQALREGQQRLGDLFAHTITDEQAYRQMGNKFVDMGVLNFRYNIDNEQEARQWVKQFATDARGDLESWAQAFPKLSEWIDIIKRQEQGETLGEAERQALEEAMPAIRNLFNEMMNHADRLDKAMRDAFQHEREQQQTRFRIAGYTDREEQADKYYANQAKQQETGAGQTFAQQLGLGSIVNDPEVLQIQNRIYWRNEEVKNAYAQLEALKSIQQMRLDMMRENGASEAELAAMEQQQAQDRAGLEQLLADRQTALFDQTNNLVTKTMQLMQKRAQSINTLTKPIQDGAQNIGRKFGEMIRGVEEDSMTWAEIWHSMAQAVGDSIIDMMAQYAQNMIMEKMMNQQSKSEALSKAQVDVAAGTASAAAKTVGQLGWWGLALIPVIAAVLHGLLAAAFASNKQNDTSKSSVTKVKQASGMLTYDEGNVSTLASGGSPARNRRKLYDDGTTQVYDRERSFSAGRGPVTARRPFLGADGHVYTATPETLPEGVKLVQHPIATTVNNQPALVAERGPEIVIGRRTTKRIQMAAPELLHAIQLIDRGYMPRLRTYDEGNVAAMAQLPAPQQGRGAEGGVGSEDAQMQQTISALTQTVALLSSTVADLQRKGIPAHINKYGTGGLIDEVKSGLRFDARYNR